MDLFLNGLVLVTFASVIWTEAVATISCEYYNATCVKESLSSGDDASQCYGVRNCPNQAVPSCFAVWSNKSGLDDQSDESYKSHLHKSGLAVKMMGCFDTSDACSVASTCTSASANPASRGGHLFCCCTGNMCNSKFEWVPEITTESPNVLGDASEHATADGDHAAGHLTLMYAVVSLVIVIVALATVFFVVRQRKSAKFAQNGMKVTEEGALPGDFSDSPSCHMQQRNIELLEIKARGRFGAVWKAKLGSDMVAVKIFPLQDKNSWQAEQEIYNLPQMDHDNILKYVGVEKRGENLQLEFWLISSFHEKGSLCDFLKSNTVTWDDLCNIAVTMAKGLTHLHEELPSTGRHEMKPSIAHRDFKSKNVLIKSDMTACIADFGLALVFEPGKPVGDTHGQVGTRRYMAPEVLEGAINFSKDAFLRIDVYACGLVLWELASRCRLGGSYPNNLGNGRIGNGWNNSGVDEYKLPFEAEVTNPSLEQMQDLVVNKKFRPKIKESWRLHPGMSAFCNTVEECWDHDAEARLSSSCILERLKNLQYMVPSGGTNEERILNTLNQANNILGDVSSEVTELSPLIIQPTNAVVMTSGSQPAEDSSCV